MRKLQVMEIRIIRIINFKCLKDHVKMNNLYKLMNILQIKDIFKLEMGNLCTFFLLFNYHNYHTKSVTKNYFFIPRMNIRYGQTACSHTGAKI